MNSNKYLENTRIIYSMAYKAVQHWKKHPNTPGDPAFALLVSEKIASDSPFRYKLIEDNPDKYLYVIHAQDILDIFPEMTEKLEIMSTRKALIKQWES